MEQKAWRIGRHLAIQAVVAALGVRVAEAVAG